MSTSDELCCLGRPFLIAFFVLISTFAWAQFGGGDGTEENPWQIGRPDHLDNIRDHLDGYFRQTGDINLYVPPWNEDQGWVPIGDSDNPFTGYFNGGEYVISGLTINRNDRYQGLFGLVTNGTLKNIALENVALHGGGYRSGSIAGMTNGAVVTNCYTTGTVTTGGGSQSAAFIGAAWGGSIITDCWTDVEFTTSGSSGSGMFGNLYGGSTARNCFSIGSVTTVGTRTVGGLAGIMGSGGNTMINCYSRSSVTAPENGEEIGGLIGRWLSGNTITNCYAASPMDVGQERVGGLIGDCRGGNTAINSYWDTQLSGLEVSDGGEGRLTRQMTYEYDETTYIDWDFDEVWVHDIGGQINDGYPFFFYQGEPPVPLDTPVLVTQLTIIDEVKHILITWEAVEEANSYRIYAVDSPDADDWGDPVAVIDGTQFSEPVDERNRRFYYVIASAAEAP